MSEESNADRRDQILNDFRQSLTLPLSERFYDEDQLIEIFDYAGDVNDDYLRLEALMCGARFYPDSQELLERRAIFYSQYGDDVRDSFLNDNEQTQGMIWDILRIRKAAPKGKNARMALDFLINSYDDFTDEEVIQLIDLASALGEFQWIKINFDNLRKHTTYPTMLIYEAAVSADINHDNRFSIKLLEELTEIEPFNPYYWQLLARQYFIIDQIDRAISAIDYSLAIDSTDLQSRLIKANLLYSNNNPIDEIIPEAEKIAHDAPDSIDAAKFLANLYNESGKQERARSALTRFINDNPTQAAYAIPDLIIYRPDNTPELLDRFYKLNDDNSEMIWVSWAQQLSVNGFADQARMVSECYQRNSGQPLTLQFNIEDLFLERRYEDTINAISDYIENTNRPETGSPSLIIMHVLSLVKLSKFDIASNLIDLVLSLPKHDAYRTISGSLEYKGMILILNQIKQKMATSVNPADWADFDPLDLWHQ